GHAPETSVRGAQWRANPAPAKADARAAAWREVQLLVRSSPFVLCGRDGSHAITAFLFCSSRFLIGLPGRVVMSRPAATEFAEFFAGYIARVPETDPLPGLEA